MKQDLSDLFLSPTDENVVCVFDSYEPFAWCCAPFSQLCDHGDINTALGREFGQIVTGPKPSP